MKNLVQLAPDHPGFADQAYRARRDFIAQVALDYAAGGGKGPIPDAPYVEEEHRVWREVWAVLGPKHRQFASREVLAILSDFPIDREQVPQLSVVSDALEERTGFRMVPVEGLVPPRRFFTHLDDGVFLSTQYVRHASRPLYTPEPDVIHELVGHAATLAHPGLASLNRKFGLAARVADRAMLARIERVYWFTLEFGLVAEGDAVKAVGAGLLSSFGEIERSQTDAEHLPWDLEVIAATDYDTSRYQDRLFVAPSFDRMIEDMDAWLDAEIGRRRPAAS